MKNGNINDFISTLYYGGELLFDYSGKEYFIQGWVKDGNSRMVLDQLNPPGNEDYLWDYTFDTMRECAEKFLNDPIWDGKSFLEIEKEVTWKDF